MGCAKVTFLVRDSWQTHACLKQTRIFPPIKVSGRRAQRPQAHSHCHEGVAFSFHDTAMGWPRPWVTEGVQSKTAVKIKPL